MMNKPRIHDIIDSFTAELSRAQQKFPRRFASAHEGYAVILEELDELWEAVMADDIDKARSEAVQVGAMAMRFILELGE